MRGELAVREINVACRFLFNGGSLETVLQDALAQDARASRLSAAFRAYYQLRSFIPLPIRQLLQRNRPVEQSPDWYFADRFERDLAAACMLASDGGIPTIHPWPD